MKKILLSLAAVFAAKGLMAQGQSVICSENFDNGIPSTWTQTTNATDGGLCPSRGDTIVKVFRIDNTLSLRHQSCCRNYCSE